MSVGVAEPVISFFALLPFLRSFAGWIPPAEAWTKLKVREYHVNNQPTQATTTPPYPPQSNPTIMTEAFFIYAVACTHVESTRLLCSNPTLFSQLMESEEWYLDAVCVAHSPPSCTRI